MTPLERLARAVLLFHGGETWTKEKQDEWLEVTGDINATNRALCNLARKLLQENENE